MPVGGQGGVTLSKMCLTATDSRLKTTSGGFLQGTGRSNAIGGVRRAAASKIGETRTESWSYTMAGTAERQKSFVHTLRRMEYVTTWSTRSSSWRRVLVEGIKERSRVKMMEELRKFIKMDNHEASGRISQVYRGLPTSGGAGRSR